MTQDSVIFNHFKSWCLLVLGIICPSSSFLLSRRMTCSTCFQLQLQSIFDKWQIEVVNPSFQHSVYSNFCHLTLYQLQNTAQVLLDSLTFLLLQFLDYSDSPEQTTTSKMENGKWFFLILDQSVVFESTDNKVY